jgi:CheY-like chemotaxis protein
MLEEQGYCVTVVPSGTEGIQRVLVSDFDAILCDMVMPNFPGDMFYRAVERSRPHLNKRFVFMTGHQDNPKVTKFIQDVRGTVLWKPFEMGKLFDALEKVTGRSR